MWRRSHPSRRRAQPDAGEPSVNDLAHDTRPSQHGHEHAQTGAATAKDPVCGMTVDPHRTPHRHEHAGRTYYFCSAGCRTRFAADPARYLGETPPAAPAAEDAIYTCPMHP